MKTPFFFLQCRVGHGADIEFHIKSEGGGRGEGLVFDIIALKVLATKLYFRRHDIWTKTCVTL